MSGKINKNSSKVTDSEKDDKFKPVGEKIEDSDPLDCQSRVVEFDKKFDFKEEIVDTIDIIENTSQYIKLINKNLAKRMEKIKDMKFEHSFTIKNDQSKPNDVILADPYSKPINELNLIEIRQLYEHWSFMKKKANDQLQQLTQKCEKILMEFKQHELKIDELKMAYENKK